MGYRSAKKDKTKKRKGRREGHNIAEQRKRSWTSWSGVLEQEEEQDTSCRPGMLENSCGTCVLLGNSSKAETSVEVTRGCNPFLDCNLAREKKKRWDLRLKRVV